jgi:Predicted transcriptional regulators
MTIGEKIKIARALRGITQKELGFLVGLTDVRIRQYETNARTPKEGKLKDIASALGVSPAFFVNHNNDSIVDLMHLFFELEETSGAHVEKIDVKGKPSTYGILFDDSSINSKLEKWYQIRELRDSDKGEEAEKKYARWKAQFPESMTTNPSKKD